MDNKELSKEDEGHIQIRSSEQAVAIRLDQSAGTQGKAGRTCAQQVLHVQKV